MTSAIAGFGTLFKRGAVTIAEVVSISGPGMSLDTEDVTSHSSTGAWEEHIGTLLRSGEVTLELNFVPTAATHRNTSGGLLYDMVQRAVQTYSITWPDAGSTVWSFSALVVGFEPEAAVDGKLSATVTLKITGAPTLA